MITLARASMAMAAAAYADYTKTLYKEMGFTDITKLNKETGNYGRTATKTDNDFVAFRIGKKTITKTGNLAGAHLYDLYVVTIRGTPGSYEWRSNFKIGERADHAGFHNAAKDVISTMEKEIKQYKDPAKIKVWITGHSRGAAVANIVAERLVSDNKSFASLNQSNVYAYTFACPAVTRGTLKNYQNIRNFNNPGDIVTQIPLEKWKFGRHGTTALINHNDKKAIEKKFKNLWAFKCLADFDKPMVYDEISYYVIDSLGNIIPKQPRKDSLEQNLLFSISDFFSNKISDKQLMNDSNIKKLAVKHIGDTQIILKYIIYNAVLNEIIKHSHIQEFYLAWLDYLVDKAK
jgi:hypothetical protein